MNRSTILDNVLLHSKFDVMQITVDKGKFYIRLINYLQSKTAELV